ncbi:MAG TPA: hypothetical protein VFI59_10220 [Actinomycetota bacterium]|nr:hypothetical protein [Actinomycetota bacterium]
MADRRSVDKGLGFVKDVTDERAPGAEGPEGSSQEDGAYEDSWYQVLKAQADGAEEA